MFALGILIGIYSYIILIIGLLGILNSESILIASAIFICCSLFYFYKVPEDLPKVSLKNKKLRPFLLLFGILALVNFIGALSPETSFDALWYHLTLPKIFLQNHAIFPITHGIFYYSVMPKLGEMLFTPSIAFGNESFAKLTQWIFGILTSVVVYKISRRYMDEKKSFFAVLVFYSSIVVAWESTVAYVDLIRAFFEAMGLWGFLIWHETKDKKILIESALFIGLAISTKLFALGTIPIFIVLFLLSDKNKFKGLKDSVFFTLIAILSAFPWFFLSLVSTGNPIFPIFSESYSKVPIISLFNPINLLKDFYNLFVRSDDPISPLFIIFLPLIFVYFKKLNKELKLISVYVALSLIAWYFIPRLGGGRFILPYLPSFSVLCVALIAQIKNETVKKYSFGLIIFVFCTTVLYRGIANSRYIPVILGIESKNDYLSKHLNFEFGDFYDTDGFFKNVVGKDRVLLYGFHNLYYADFNFIHESFVRPSDRFTYVATQDSELPDRFKKWDMIYENPKTHVKVYSLKGIEWHY